MVLAFTAGSRYGEDRMKKKIIVNSRDLSDICIKFLKDKKEKDHVSTNEKGE